MKLIRGGVVLVGLLGAASAAQAGLSSTWTVASDYDFRGISQTAKDPALQASLDYTHPSGFYISAWGSNVDFGTRDPDVEVDIYGGFTRQLDSGLNYDFGGIYYTYHSSPAQSPDYVEAYAGLGYTDKSGLSIKGKLFYSPDFGGSSTPGHTPAKYLTADLTMPLPSNFSLMAHAAYSWGDYWDGGFLPPGNEYVDYALGVGYTYGKFSVSLKYIDGSDLEDGPGDVFDTRSKVFLSVATTFPWGE